MAKSKSIRQADDDDDDERSWKLFKHTNILLKIKHWIAIEMYAQFSQTGNDNALCCIVFSMLDSETGVSNFTIWLTVAAGTLFDRLLSVELSM